MANATAAKQWFLTHGGSQADVAKQSAVDRLIVPFVLYIVLYVLIIVRMFAIVR
jgi:hypothetical protein